MAREVGIVITAKDSATKVFNSVANSVEKMATKSVEKIKKVEWAAGGFSVKLNGMMNLAQKASRVIQQAFAATVGASIESRAKTDHLRASWDKLGKSAQELGIHIGDSVAPAIVSLGNAFKPVLKSLDDWIKANEAATSQTVLDGFITIGKAIVLAFSTAGLVVSRTYRFMQLGALAFGRTWHLLMAKVKEPMLGMLQVMEAVAVAQGDLAHASKLEALRNEWFQSEESAREYSRSIVQAIEDQNQLEMSIHKAAEAAYDGFGVAAAKGVQKFGKALRQTAFDAAVAADQWFADVEKHFEAKREKKFQDRMVAMANTIGVKIRSWGGAFQYAADKGQLVADVVQAQQDKILESANKGLPELFEAWQTYGQIVAENAGRPSVEIPQMLERLKESTKQVADEIGTYIAGIIGDLRKEMDTIGDIQTDTVEKIAIVAKNNTDHIYGYVENITKAEIEALERTGRTAQVVTETMAIRTRNLGDAIKSVFKNMVDAVIAEFMRMAAIKIVGGILNLFSGGAGGSLFTGLASALTAPQTMNFKSHGGMLHAAHGMTIPYAGAAGRDSVPFIGMPGERVLTRTETHNYNMTNARGGGGDRPIIVQAGPTVQQFVVAPSRAQVRRIQRDVWEPERKTMIKRGLIKG